jgi:hypothetical protein
MTERIKLTAAILAVMLVFAWLLSAILVVKYRAETSTFCETCGAVKP